jgi:two-component system, LytTR family, response regulator
MGGRLLKIAICDDDPSELKKATDMIEEFILLKRNFGDHVCRVFGSGSELLADIRLNGGYDLLILDILMPGLSGIDLATLIREQDDACRIIFLTSSSDFAVASYKVKAYYYILKSNIKTELPALLQSAADELAGETASSILIKEKYRWTRVPLKKIKYIESSNHTVYFHLSSNETISSYNTIQAYQQVVLSDSRFIKCHKSYIVNMNFVTNITHKEFVLEGNVTVPISRNLFGQVKDGYFDFMFKRRG